MVVVEYHNGLVKKKARFKEEVFTGKREIEYRASSDLTIISETSHADGIRLVEEGEKGIGTAQWIGTVVVSVQ